MVGLIWHLPSHQSSEPMDRPSLSSRGGRQLHTDSQIITRPAALGGVYSLRSTQIPN